MFNLKDFKQAYQKFWLGYRSFKERTSRKDYWLAMLGHGLVTLVLLVMAFLLEKRANDVLPDIWSVFAYFLIGLWLLYVLFSLLPFGAMAVRRLHDIALPWELVFILLAPIGGVLGMLILNTLPSVKSQAYIPEFSEASCREAKIQEEKQVTFFQALKHYLFGYASFSGRTNRASFWMVQLVLLLLFTFSLALLSAVHLLESFIFGGSFVATWLLLALVFLLAISLMLPTLAIFARRFRDAGLSNFSIGIIFITAVALLLLRISSYAVNTISFGIHDFSLLNYLLFLFSFVFLLSLITVAVQDSNQLVQDKKTLLFRKKG